MLETHAPGVLSEALKEALLSDGTSAAATLEVAAEQPVSGRPALDADVAGAFIWKAMARWGYPNGWIASKGASLARVAG